TTSTNGPAYCDFNGATARRPWRTPTPGVPPPRSCTLQWGHGTKAVENAAPARGRSFPVWHFNGATARRPWRTPGDGHGGGECGCRELQWGHGTKAVENWHRRRTSVPAPKSLQWGHGTKAVENPRSSPRFAAGPS